MFKNSSLLPEGLFASLGVSRGIEGDLRGVKLVSGFLLPTFLGNFLTIGW